MMRKFAIWMGALVALTGACSPSASESGEDLVLGDDSLFWETLRVNADEVEGYESMAEMAIEADAVVLGTIESIDGIRTVQGDAAEDVVTYVVASVRVDDTLRGSAEASQPILLEFLLNLPVDRTDAAVDDLRRALPDGDLVLFLRAKRGGEESGRYRLVNSLGLWAQTTDGLGSPLAGPSEDVDDEEGPTGDIGLVERYADELAGLSTVVDLAEMLRAG